MDKSCLRVSLIIGAITISILSEFILPLSALSNSIAYQKASGTLTIEDGKSRRNVDLKHAYASDAPYSTPDGLVITFTDKPLPDDPVKSWNYARLAGSEGKLNALVVVLDADRNVSFSAVYLDTSGTSVSDRECWMNYESADGQKRFARFKALMPEARSILDFSSQVGRKYVINATGKVAMMLKEDEWKIYNRDG